MHPEKAAGAFPGAAPLIRGGEKMAGSVDASSYLEWRWLVASALQEPAVYSLLVTEEETPKVCSASGVVFSLSYLNFYLLVDIILTPDNT